MKKQLIAIAASTTLAFTAIAVAPIANAEPAQQSKSQLIRKTATCEWKGVMVRGTARLTATFRVSGTMPNENGATLTHWSITNFGEVWDFGWKPMKGTSVVYSVTNATNLIGKGKLNSAGKAYGLPNQWIKRSDPVVRSQLAFPSAAVCGMTVNYRTR